MSNNGVVQNIPDLINDDGFYADDINPEIKSSEQFIDIKIGEGKDTSRYKRVYIYERRTNYETDENGNVYFPPLKYTAEYEEYLDKKEST